MSEVDQDEDIVLAVSPPPETVPDEVEKRPSRKMLPYGNNNPNGVFSHRHFRGIVKTKCVSSHAFASCK